MPAIEPSLGATGWNSWGNAITAIANAVETAPARIDALEATGHAVTSVTGLQAILDNLNTRLTALENAGQVSTLSITQVAKLRGVNWYGMEDSLRGPTLAELQDFAARGYNMVRLPTRWDTPNAAIAAILADAVTARIWIGVERHNYGRIGGTAHVDATDGTVISSANQQQWFDKCVADLQAFNGYTSYIPLDMNEPKQDGSVWEPISQGRVAALRDAGWTGVIGVSAAKLSSAGGINNSDAHPDGWWITDPKAFLEVHQYLQPLTDGHLQTRSELDAWVVSSAGQAAGGTGLTTYVQYINRAFYFGAMGDSRWTNVPMVIGEFSIPPGCETELEQFFDECDTRNVGALQWSAGMWPTSYPWSMTTAQYNVLSSHTPSGTTVGTTGGTSSGGSTTPPTGGSGVFTADNTAPAASTSLTVDIRSTTYALDQRWSLGSTITTYSGDGGSGIRNNSQWKAKLQALGPLAWRIPLAWNGGQPGSSAGGARSSGDASVWIKGIRDIGGTPLVVCGGTTGDNDIVAADVANLVNYFNSASNVGNGGRIDRWILGNEVTLAGGISARDAYTAALPGWISAMKNVDSTIKCGAPAAASWNDSGHIQIVAGVTGVDALGYHAYDGQDTTQGLGFPLTSQYGTHIDNMRTWKSNATWLGVEEFNFDYSYTSQRAEIIDWRSLVWNASVIGHVLTRGGVALHYGDCTGAVGLLADGTQNGIQPGPRGTPYPAYWALGIWTGMNGQFRRFGGSMATCTSNVANVDVFACTNGKIVITNKANTSQSVTIGVGGKASGVYDLWQIGNSQLITGPTKVASGVAFSGNLISLTVPAGTASSLELSNSVA